MPVDSSEMAMVEVIRACRRVNAVALPGARAVSVRSDLSASVAYDRRLADAASAAGLETLQPERESGSRGAVRCVGSIELPQAPPVGRTSKWSS